MKFYPKVLIGTRLCDCVGVASQITSLHLMLPHILLVLFLPIHTYLPNSYWLSFRCQYLTSFSLSSALRLGVHLVHTPGVSWSLGLPVLGSTPTPQPPLLS